MTQLQLLHDPVNGTPPRFLAERNNAIEVRFHEVPADGTCCRCNRALNLHVWQLVDPGLAEQRGVIDCETKETR